MTDFGQLCGWIATGCFAACYLPQLVRTYRRKEVGDISLWQWLFQLVGYVAGLVYGGYLFQMPLIIGYFWGFFCTVIFLVMYWRYR